MIRPPEKLESDRLLLRFIVMQDAEEVFKYAADPEVARYVTYRAHQDIHTLKEFIRRCLYEAGKGTRFTWVMARKADQQLIGHIDLCVEEGKCQLGYILSRDHWGQGFMTEAVKALVDWTLAQPSVHRVWAVCDLENPASARVMEKAGMQKEGLLRRWNIHPNISEVPRDCWCYAKVK